MNILLSTPYDWAIFHKCFLPKFMMQLCIIIHGILNLQSKFGCNYKSVNYFNGTSLKVWKFYFQSNQKETSFIEPSVTENPSETENRNRVHNRHEHHHRHQHLHHQHQHHHHHHHRKNGEDGQTASPPIRLLIEEPYIHRTLYFSEFASKTTFFQNCHFLLSGFDFVYFTEAPN